MPGKGPTYAAARLVLGREPGAWVVEQRGQKPRPSYGLLATDLSAMLARANKDTQAGRRIRARFATLFGSLTPWPDRVTFETMRAWELIGLHEQEMQDVLTPADADEGTSEEPPAMVEIPPHDIPPAIFQSPADT